MIAKRKYVKVTKKDPKEELRKELRTDDKIELFPYWRGHQTIKDLEDVAREVLEWSRTTDAISVSSFCLDRNMHPKRMYDWMERCPELKEAWELAKLRIGNRRERLGLEGEYNSSIVLAKMPLFDDEYKAWKEKMAANSVSAGGGTVVVNMNKIESDIAPRKDEE